MKIIKFPTKRVEVIQGNLALRLTSIKAQYLRGQITKAQATARGISDLTQTHRRLITLAHETANHEAEVKPKQVDALEKAKEVWKQIVDDAKA